MKRKIYSDYDTVFLPGDFNKIEEHEVEMSDEEYKYFSSTMESFEYWKNIIKSRLDEEK